MRLRVVAMAALALALVAATGATARPTAPRTAQANDLTVWLMSDAQSNWPEAVAAANRVFEARHPGSQVTVQYQGWGDYKTKFEATLAAGNGPDVLEFGNSDVTKYAAAGNGPDVLEFGNSDVTKYAAAGALASLTKSDFANSSSWLNALTQAGTYNGKVY